MSDRFPSTDTVVEASDIGLRPGFFPERLTWQGRQYGAVGVDKDREGEVHGVRYEDEQGRRLLVIND